MKPPDQSFSLAMQWTLCFALLNFFLSPTSLAAANKNPLTYSDAKHFLGRTSFTANHQTIEALVGKSRMDAAEQLLRRTTTKPLGKKPDWAVDGKTVTQRRQDFRRANATKKQELRKQRRQMGFDLRSWWYEEMLTTDSPFTERITLFWHNHFTSSLKKVKFPTLMYMQNLKLRRHALGNFRDLLLTLSKDPAMLIYLDGAQNRRGHPNENFAREVMELFTLGEGHYTENDVQEAARAFTGWSINPRTGDFVVRKRQHDNGLKTIFGQTGRFTGDDVLRMILQNRQTAVHIVTKLWRDFIGTPPSSAEIERLANLFFKSNYEIKPLMRQLLSSEAFYSRQARANRIKSPVELIVGTLRQFDVHTNLPRSVLNNARVLGQDVFNPPNVKGWPGETQWINSNTLLIRKQMMSRLIRSADLNEKMQSMTGTSRKQRRRNNKRMLKMQQRMQQMVHADFNTWFMQFHGTEEQKRLQATNLLLPTKPLDQTTEDVDGETDLLTFVESLLLDPAYQLN